jgi:glycosyltransferase involved in cell wall biosynthesis
MKKVLIHSNHSKAFTGFGKHTKNLLIFLQKTGKYELIEFANGRKWSDPTLSKMPWKTYGSAPDSDIATQKASRDPKLKRQLGYGGIMIDEVIEKEKPDVYIGIEDIWAFSGYWEKPWWDKINHAVWTTLDSLPILPEAVSAAPRIKNYFVWASFAEKAMKELGHGHVKMIRGSLETNQFFKLNKNDKLKLRSAFGIDEKEFIIGFVFRNQLRKSVPNLLDGFKIFRDKNPESKAKLLLHTNWSEGWDIPRLLKEKEIDPSLVLTTYYCSKCKNYEVKTFVGQQQNCKFCGSEKTQNTTSVNAGVSEDQLNQVYNLMDVYCHPFTSGGQEIPIQEAKLTELITLVTNYSCGEDCCTEESGGLPLNWKEYREPGTQFIKATTDPFSIYKQLNKVYKMNEKDLEQKGKIAREFVLKNFSIEVIGRQVEEFIDSCPEIEYNFDIKPHNKKRNNNYPLQKIEDNLEWLIDLYKNILIRDVDENDDGIKHWMAKIQQGGSRESIHNYFISVANKENQEIVDSLDRILREDTSKKIAIVVNENATETFLCTSLLPSIKRLYADHNIYFFAPENSLDILKGNPHIYKSLPVSEDLFDCISLEKKREGENFFDVVYYPSDASSGAFRYCHQGRDKIEYKTEYAHT